VSGKFDSIVIDGLVNLTANTSGAFGLVFRKFQTGKVQTYVVFAVFSVVIFYFIFRFV
jgi:NADH-quinone oxidoreductase subunit L